MKAGFCREHPGKSVAVDLSSVPGALECFLDEHTALPDDVSASIRSIAASVASLVDGGLAPGTAPVRHKRPRPPAPANVDRSAQPAELADKPRKEGKQGSRGKRDTTAAEDGGGRAGAAQHSTPNADRPAAKRASTERKPAGKGAERGGKGRAVSGSPVADVWVVAGQDAMRQRQGSPSCVPSAAQASADTGARASRKRAAGKARVADAAVERGAEDGALEQEREAATPADVAAKTKKIKEKKKRKKKDGFGME